MVPQISISEGEPIMALPLVLVVAISMLKDGYEDFMRHQDDKKENYTDTIVVNKSTNQEKVVRWHEVRVGDFIKVKEDQFFPADMVIISSANEDGLFFVETKSLDGETNLKTKNIQDDLGRLKIGHEKGKKQFSDFKPSVQIEAPNANMHKFSGNITFE